MLLLIRDDKLKVDVGILSRAQLSLEVVDPRRIVLQTSGIGRADMTFQWGNAVFKFADGGH